MTDRGPVRHRRGGMPAVVALVHQPRRAGVTGMAGPFWLLGAMARAGSGNVAAVVFAAVGVAAAASPAAGPGPTGHQERLTRYDAHGGHAVGPAVAAT